MKNDFHTLITNMKALRIFSGSSQEQTSASLHLSRSTYASYESGLRTPPKAFCSLPCFVVGSGLCIYGRTDHAADPLSEK